MGLWLPKEKTELLLRIRIQALYYLVVGLGIGIVLKLMIGFSYIVRGVAVGVHIYLIIGGGGGSLLSGLFLAASMRIILLILRLLLVCSVGVRFVGTMVRTRTSAPVPFIFRRG
jgi:hypothetical protein